MVKTMFLAMEFYKKKEDFTIKEITMRKMTKVSKNNL